VQLLATVVLLSLGGHCHVFNNGSVTDWLLDVRGCILHIIIFCSFRLFMRSMKIVRKVIFFMHSHEWTCAWYSVTLKLKTILVKPVYCAQSTPPTVLFPRHFRSFWKHKYLYNNGHEGHKPSEERIEYRNSKEEKAKLDVLTAVFKVADESSAWI